MHAPSPPTPVAGRYVMERELGRGGMATVYLARDLQHEGPVALKVLRPELALAAGGGRFAREIQITARLQHPHILPVLDSGEFDGVPYYTMPFVDGGSLAARLARERQLAIPETLRVVGEVADALAYAHARGVIHRDIKPANILLSAGGALLADFGIARALDVAHGDRLTESGMALGTAYYMSPEQAAGDRVDARSDVYALGCVLYEALAGAPPFSGSTPQAVLARHAVDPVPSLTTVRRTVGPALERAVNTALAKVPADRFPDAAAFRAALDEAAAEQSALATGAVPAVPALTPRPARGRPRPAATPAALGLLGVVAAAGAGALAWRQGLAGRADRAALDANRIAVFPLVVGGDSAASSRAGENVATIIGSAIDASGALRAVDGWRLLDAAARANPRLLGEDDARALARAQRCGSYVTGHVVFDGDSATVTLHLNRADVDSAVTSTAIGLAASAAQLGPRAVNGLLAARVPGARPDLAAEWEGRAPAAVTQFLLGEAAFRRLHLADALAHYRAAVARDSAFALAAVRGAEVSTWNHRPDAAEAFLRAAFSGRLAPRYAEFARGYAHFVAGRADSAAAAFRRVVRRDADMAAAWVQLGEVYTHLLPAAEGPDAPSPDAQAEAAFDRAHRLDPAAANLLPHLIAIKLRRGDLAHADSLAARLLAARPDSALAEQVEVMRACARGGPRGVEWSDAVRRAPLAVLAAAAALAGGGARLDCAEAAYGAALHDDSVVVEDVDGYRWAALVGLQGVLVAQGRTAAAAAQVDSAIARELGGASLLVLDATLVPALAGRADSLAAAEARLFGANYERCPYPLRLWYLGLWAAHRGQASVAAAVAKKLDATARERRSARDSLYARSVAAHAALARGDSVDARARFEAMLAEPMADLAWDLVTPRAAERLALARLLLAAGEPQRALDVAGGFDAAWPAIHALYLPASLQVRADAATALGRGPLAVRYRDRLAQLGGQAVAVR